MYPFVPVMRSESELQLACNEYNITITSTYMYTDNISDKFSCDKWACTIHFNDKAATFEYFSGVGHRVKNQPVAPNVADVLYCLLSDANACNTSFDNWCDDLGSNSDSLEALNTYLASQRNGDKLNKLLGRTLVIELQNKEH